MLNLLKRLLSEHEKSSETARRRLRMVLVMDRVGLASEYLIAMRDDILQVVSRYLVVEQEAVELEVRRTGDSVTLVSNIPIKDIVRTRDGASLRIRPGAIAAP